MGKKKRHGGKREGAGREFANPEGPTIPVTASVPQALMEQLDAIADRNEWKRSKAVTEAIRGFVANSGKISGRQRNRT